MVKKKLDVPIYRRKIQAYIGYSYDELQSAIKKEFGITVDGIEKDTHRGAVYTLENKTRGIKCLVFWCEFPKDIESFSHEVFHLTATILQDAGVTLTEESEEAWAYLYGYLYSKLAI